MCWHHLFLKDSKFLKVEISYKSPKNTGFDILLIGVVPSLVEQKRIVDAYKNHIPLQKFRGGVKDVLFYATEILAGITHTYNYTLTPYGSCDVQKNIKDGLTSLGVSNFLTVQNDYNTYVRSDPTNAETILRDRGHIS